MWPGLHPGGAHTHFYQPEEGFFFGILQRQTHFSVTRGCFPSAGELFLIIITCYLVQRGGRHLTCFSAGLLVRLHSQRPASLLLDVNRLEKRAE